MKSLLGSVVFVTSLFVLRRILVESGLLPPGAALVFLACLIGVPLGGILFLEGALDATARDLRREIDSLREEIATLRGSSTPPDA